MKIFLAGGLYSNWQDEVMKAYPKHTYYDPRSHGLVLCEQYTPWNLKHVEMADMVFACFDKENPTGFGMTLEIGVALGLGMNVILVDEQMLESWASTRLTCFVARTMEEGLARLGIFDGKQRK